jgi:nitronate monooxygenase
MWSDRRLLELFEIEHPIVPAPMAGFGTVGLAAAVADSGGLGSIGCATMNPQLAVETKHPIPYRCCRTVARPPLLIEGSE